VFHKKARGSKGRARVGLQKPTGVFHKMRNDRSSLNGWSVIHLRICAPAPACAPDTSLVLHMILQKKVER
jgi:hypothetical protein